MSGTTESDLKSGLVEALAALPGVVALPIQTTTMTGVPDVVACRIGACAWIEVKFRRPTSRWKVTRRQELLLRRLHGYLVTYVLRRDGTRLVEILEYGGDVVFEDVVHVEPGQTWADAHRHVARSIAIARLGI